MIRPRSGDRDRVRCKESRKLVKGTDLLDDFKVSVLEVSDV